ncbi:hypothetical protein H9Y04_26445 [Streptomyces sp. TRM66268-LWL]|uniref:Integral membrane protein n=1 Tax=Streptomyces polyasparticus TaxID=2767826 RepID=A0ABR7SKT2_9ACTN|nr:hypothetical protein [Streptomyces polyasparticus]MBC9716086.1 hypothetical protein [Streptomyces polyasparticus]
MKTPHTYDTGQGTGSMERGTAQRLAARQRWAVQAWTALAVLAAVWSLAWAIGWITDTADSLSFAVAGLPLLAAALWARRSAVRNAPPRHL